MKPSMGVYTGTPPIRNSDFTGGMVELSEKEMEQISAGATAQCNAWKVICVAASVGSIFGALGLALTGPALFSCVLDEVINFSHCS